MGPARPGRAATVRWRAVLRFEHRLVDALCTAPEPERRAGVERFVTGTLADMPEHLRLGVGALSLVLGLWDRARPGRTGSELVAAMEHSPLGPVRQHVRLFRSLVLFAEEELAGAGAPAGATPASP